MDRLNISFDKIAKIAMDAALSVPGVAKMTDTPLTMYFDSMISGKNNTSGVFAATEKEHLVVHLYFDVAFGSRMTEVAWNVQTKVKEELEKTVNIPLGKIEIFIQGVSTE